MCCPLEWVAGSIPGPGLRRFAFFVFINIFSGGGEQLAANVVQIGTFSYKC